MLSKHFRFMTVGLVLAVALGAYAADSRTKLKPGWNLFSPQQDIEMGRESAKQAEKQLPILNDRQANSYIDALGKRLASHAPGEKYPYQFKIVNDTAINAFALPGGFVYVNRGAIEAADSENQIAGVMAHEIGHVVLRHGTNQRIWRKRRSLSWEALSEATPLVPCWRNSALGSDSIRCF